MSTVPAATFKRSYTAILAARLGEPRRFLQVVAGPRQVGKTTLVQQVRADSQAAQRLRLCRRAGVARRSLAHRSVGARAPRSHRQAGCGAGARRGAENPGLVGDGEAALGRGQPRASAAPSDPARRGAVAHAARSFREPHRALRNPLATALVARRDAGGVRLLAGTVSLLRWISGRRAARGRPAALASLPDRKSTRLNSSH